MEINFAEAQQIKFQEAHTTKLGSLHAQKNLGRKSLSFPGR